MSSQARCRGHRSRTARPRSSGADMGRGCWDVDQSGPHHTAHRRLHPQAVINRLPYWTAWQNGCGHTVHTAGSKKVSMMSQWSLCRVMMMSQGHIEVIAPHPCITHHRFIKNVSSNLFTSSQILSKFSLSHVCSLPVGATMTF